MCEREQILKNEEMEKELTVKLSDPSRQDRIETKIVQRLHEVESLKCCFKQM